LDAIPPNDGNLTMLLSKCPILESLMIEGHLGHMDVGISSSTLKHLEIADFV
ncbi:hypothetical protein MKX03_030185, partial [Papaver bracteatum]